MLLETFQFLFVSIPQFQSENRFQHFLKRKEHLRHLNILQHQFKYHNFSFEVYSPLTSGIAHLRTYLDFCLGLDSRSHRYISFKFSFVCHAGWFLKGWLRKIVSNFAKLNLLLWCKHQNIICQEFVGMRCSLVRSRGILLSKYFSCGVTHLKL